ncbi:hypothetical protein LQ954_12285 [Sphingomonas sp. IC-11]|uniref:hypothetical protein n=1 Tax=Sphingomonas sp. IC-11 TaxID=2898528 RepID=UPI001E50C5DE|nr:hypothetical protein [Sphingomonas sp. IC-11]MCD2316929.1 hypothetical protein [Sphingomonas sp. IC-11]
MSNGQLGGPAPRRDDDIQDAEFVEIENWQAAPAPPAPPLSGHRGCLSYGLKSFAAVLLLLIVMCVASPAPESTSTDGNVGAVSDENVASDLVAEEVPSLAELVQRDDARACGHPDVAANIRERILPRNDDGDARRAQIQELARIDLTEVTASDIRSDVHELTCDANLRYGDGADDLTPITFKLRAAVDPAQPPVLYFDMPLWDLAALVAAITDRPRARVDAERAERAPPPQESEPLSLIDPPAGDDPGVAPSDEDRFAPH